MGVTEILCFSRERKVEKGGNKVFGPFCNNVYIYIHFGKGIKTLKETIEEDDE